MRKLIPLLSLFVISACDVINKCDGYACYPGAPDIAIEFHHIEEIDSSFFLLKAWDITDSGVKLRIRYAGDTVWNSSESFMSLAQTDSSIQFFGNGIIWDNLDDLRADIIFDYGNEISDTLVVEIGEATENCCTYNFIDAVYFNDVLIERKPNEFSYNIDLGE